MVKAERKKKPVVIPVPEKKVQAKTEYQGLDYGNKKVAKPLDTRIIFPRHSKNNKVEKYYPRLFRWDKLQQ